MLSRYDFFRQWFGSRWHYSGLIGRWPVRTGARRSRAHHRRFTKRYADDRQKGRR